MRKLKSPPAQQVRKGGAGGEPGASPPGRHTRVGARMLGSGWRERRNRRSANTAVARRKTAASVARATMMGMQGPQGSGAHEEASVCTEGGSGVGGI